jgi:hypothetical protein
VLPSHRPAPPPRRTVPAARRLPTAQEEARDAFAALLAAKGVGPDDTWEGALRAIINDPRYGALKSLGERKAAFNEYVQVGRGAGG